MILSYLPSPAEAGFAKAGSRFPSSIGVEDKLFGIMRYFHTAKPMPQPVPATEQ